ncbi:GAF domain-containing protein [Phenylobacterium sp. LjRoot164]|uniref:sensor histidine kinase n=1 Tax=unclassified Phenylobacterium TaxID=2640670 RepID=UPI003ECE267C
MPVREFPIGVLTTERPPPAPQQALQALYEFTDRLLRASDQDEICEAALEALERALGCPRASVLLFDQAGVMRFVAWRGISEGYRRAVDGHTPWAPGQTGAAPICISDIIETDEPEALKTTILGEGIRSLAFVPLTAGGAVIGKFMVYKAEPHVFGDEEVSLALTIARQLAFALERLRAEQDARRQKEQFEALFDNIPVMIKLFDPSTGALRFNAEFLRAVGWDGSSDVDLMAELFPDSELRKRVAGYMRDCPAGWFDAPMRTLGGRTIETSWANIKLSDSTRVGIGIDVTDRKQALERQNLLLREVDHRVRNLFSLASGMVRLSAREAGDRAALAADLQERLAALAAAHSLTMRLDGEGAEVAPLHQLIHAIMAPYQRAADGQLEVAGSDFALTGEAATSFAMLIYEFATNAVKYGALSVPQGRVKIETRVRNRELELLWEESGGPAVDAPPEAVGFGSRLTRATVAQLDGRLEQVWRPEGLLIRLAASLDRCEPPPRKGAG